MPGKRKTNYVSERLTMRAETSPRRGKRRKRAEERSLTHSAGGRAGSGGDVIIVGRS